MNTEVTGLARFAANVVAAERSHGATLMLLVFMEPADGGVLVKVVPSPGMTPDEAQRVMDLLTGRSFTWGRADK